MLLMYVFRIRSERLREPHTLASVKEARVVLRSPDACRRGSWDRLLGLQGQAVGMGGQAAGAGSVAGRLSASTSLRALRRLGERWGFRAVRDGVG
jgi:hypothetical protein